MSHDQLHQRLKHLAEVISVEGGTVETVEEMRGIVHRMTVIEEGVHEVAAMRGDVEPITDWERLTQGWLVHE